MKKVKKKKSQWRWLIIPVISFALFGLANFLKGNTTQSEQPIVNYKKGLKPKENAVNKVKALPDVVDYLKRVPNGLIEVNGDEDNFYLVQVYELKDGHTATFNWYKVDKTTGEIQKEL